MIPHDLNQLAVKIGQNPMLVQGAGGNISMKVGDTCWVKASGTWLAHALEKPIFVPVKMTNTGVDKNGSPACAGDDGVFAGDDDVVASDDSVPHLRPSIETAMHTLMPHKVVVHVHSIHALVWLVQTNGESLLREKLKALGLSWAWVPYVKPGEALAEAIEGVLVRGALDVIFLANHGVVVGADDADQAWALLQTLETTLTTPSRLPEDHIIDSLATDPMSFSLAKQGALYPDHVVFLGKAPCVQAAGDDRVTLVDQYTKLYNKRPEYILMPQRGVWLDEAASPAMKAMLWCQAMVLARLQGTEAIRYLTDDEMNALIHWEAEKYRQTMS